MLLTAACWGSAQASGDVEREFRCGPGDALAVEVFEASELSGTFTVDSDGVIRPPLIGDVRVLEMTASEIEERLEAGYRGKYLRDPQISVSVESDRSRPVHVVGAVEKPGVYQLEGRRRLLEVIAMAGGLAEQAGARVRVSRGDGTGGRRVRVDELLQGDPSADLWIEPHDTVQVEAAGVVYVLGAVQKAGGFPLERRERMTALRGLALAQGTSERAALQRALIIRSDGEDRDEIEIRLKDVIAGKVADPTLYEDDILFVPDSRLKGGFRQAAAAALQMAVGVVIWRR